MVASRLSENPDITVLVLEAGGEENILTDIPLTSAANEMSAIDWQYKTVPQKNACFGLDNNVTIFRIDVF